MEGSDGSPPHSICMIRAAELYPKPQMEKEDNDLTVPFQELAGESVKYLGRTDDGVLALSTYRIFMLKNSTNSDTSVPLGLIDSVHTRDLFHLIISCKDASTVKCSFQIAEQCSDWQRRIQLSIGVPQTLETLFAFPFYSYMCDAISLQNAGNGNFGGSVVGSVNAFNKIMDSAVENTLSSACYVPDYMERLQRAPRHDDDFMREVERMGFDLKGAWRISNINEDFKLCPTYPQKLLVPGCISDEMMQNVANFRSSKRLPSVLWRHQKSGAVIARCSQPEVGWLGWRSSKDEQLLKALADACAFERGEQSRLMQENEGTQAPTSGGSSPSSPDGSHEEVALDEVKKILIVDARSYTSAVTNRARGGGCECVEYYPSIEIQFMNLGNIHAIRKSFQSLRQLCASPPDCPNWLGLLEKTMWLQHLSGLLAATVTVCHAVDKKGQPVLVHCSDGWDRTPQITATAQLCLDPYYRTVEGFRILVEREWLAYGHKFADRCGHGPGTDDTNERCPVFLQWLDLVHQIHQQFPCSFEFSLAYLIKLAQHSHSCLFGTFLCNTYKERLENSVFERTFSVWPFLSGPMYKNPLYVPNKDQVLWPGHNVRDLHLWTDVYLVSLGNQNSIDFPLNSLENMRGYMNPMAKTRSYGDLNTAGLIENGISRRSSDPNMTVDPSVTMGLSSENNSMTDIQSEREDSPDNAYLIHDTTQKIQNLTIELNNHDIPTGNHETLQKSVTKINERSEEVTQQSHVQQPWQKINNIQSSSTTNDEGSKVSINTNGFDKKLNGTSEAIKEDTDKSTGKEMENCGIASNKIPTNTKMCDMSLGLMQSVDLSDVAYKTDPGVQCDQQDIWHGSINTSTDTLVPIENRQQFTSTNGTCCDMDCKKEVIDCDESDGTTSKFSKEIGLESLTQERKLFIDNILTNNGGTNYSILPKVHNVSNIGNRSNVLSTSSRSASVSSTSSSLNNFNNFSNNNHSSNNTNSRKNSLNTTDQSEVDSENDGSILTKAFRNTKDHIDPLDESILILPEHRKLEISVSGKCETVSSNVPPLSAATIGATATTPSTAAQSNAPWMGVFYPQRRRRTSSSNSRRDGFTTKPANGSTTSRFSLPGVRSLPMTPPGLPERPQITISCPDGLAHALSEQNLRLQQIVHEHKLREDVLMREIHDMRMALLKKICPNCNNAAAINDEQCSTTDNIENASICSWEAVEDRSGPSSCTSSSIQQNTTSVLWVPDHAVSRCTSCQTEFWLGRRKHHCRSCGQIFCADCSEFWAPLPDEKLFSPVRLCGPCYHAVTTKMQSRSVTTSGISNNTMNNTMAATTSPVTSSSLPLNLGLVSTTTSLSTTSTSLTQAILHQQQHRQTAATASAAVAAAAASAATNSQIDSSNMSHLLLANNIAASVAN